MKQANNIEKIIIWQEQSRDNELSKKDKTKVLIEFVEKFGLKVNRRVPHGLMPMIIASGSDEQIKKLEASGEVSIENNDKWYASNNTPAGKIPNCS